MENIELDVHTHTIASGHAYSSLSEMVAGAKEKDIKLLGIVEHDQGIPGTCAPIYFKNLDVIPREIEGIKLLLGIEINILDHQGRLSITEDLYDYVDYCMAGIHLHCYEAGTIEENTRAVIETIKNPHISVIVHPDDGKCPLDYEKVVLAAKKYHTLGSDAHIHFDIKNYDQIEELLKEVEFPKELIVNYHIEDFLEYIKKQVRY